MFGTPRVKLKSCCYYRQSLYLIYVLQVQGYVSNCDERSMTEVPSIPQGIEGSVGQKIMMRSGQTFDGNVLSGLYTDKDPPFCGQLGWVIIYTQNHLCLLGVQGSDQVDVGQLV